MAAKKTPKRRAESREGMVTTTVAFEKAMYEALAIAAIKERAAITQLIRDAVAAWLSARQRRRRGGTT